MTTPTPIAAVVQAAELATAGQAAAAAATRNAATIANLAEGITTPPSSPAVSVAPGAVNGHGGG